MIDQDHIDETASDFVRKVKSLLPLYDARAVLNTDQCGLELEVPSNRSLSYRGEKNTVASVRSINATTHSYTIQPTISLSGNLVGPVFVCLKELGGRMSERIRSNLPVLNNVVVTCSSSGKLTTSLVEYWLSTCLVPSISTSTLLLSDSWSGQGDKAGIYDSISGLKRLEIPKKTTSTIQPMDVFFNRQWKKIIRKAHERVVLDDIDVRLSQRNNILRLQSLVHNQLSSPMFSPMIRYAWFKSGYLSDDPGPFSSVIQVCFSFNQDFCDQSSCEAFSFIQCSYCRHVLCFEHFFLGYHTHGI